VFCCGCVCGLDMFCSSGVGLCLRVVFVGGCFVWLVVLECVLLCGFFLYEWGCVRDVLEVIGGFEGAVVGLLLVNPLVDVCGESGRFVLPSRLSGYALVCGDSRCNRFYGLYRRCFGCEKVYGLDLCLRACFDGGSTSIDDLKKRFVGRSLELLGRGWSFEAGCGIGSIVLPGFLDYLCSRPPQAILLFRRGDGGEIVDGMRVFRFWRLFKPVVVGVGEEAAKVYAGAGQRLESVKSFEGVVGRLKAVVEAVRDGASRAQLESYVLVMGADRGRRRGGGNVEVKKLEDVVRDYLGGIENFFRWAEQHSHIVAPEARLVVES